MTQILLEHVNMTVTDADRTAAMLSALFAWRIRWSGPSKGGGVSVHVGDDERYVALYSPQGAVAPAGDGLHQAGAVNHLGILVADLDAAERRVLDHGLKTHSHQAYDPGSRFYFHDHDGIEYEVVSYA
jgi:catechol 2,3-dioxygenase-like lactoylglutathione lyase family enzyme